MTLERWLATREPVPPPALAARLRALLGDAALAADVAEAPETLATAAERALGRLLGDGCETRAAALDLLAADALVTYAFEAAAETPATLRERATAAARRIARIPATGARGARA